jgi:hypothetical protein
MVEENAVEPTHRKVDAITIGEHSPGIYVGAIAVRGVRR